MADRVCRFRPAPDVNMATCDEGSCSWKRRGPTVVATHIATEEHAIKTGHSVTVSTQQTTVITGANVGDAAYNAARGGGEK